MPPPLRILILSGPTREYLDPVRYLSNASTGRQGTALAAAARARGHHVEVVTGPGCVALPSDVETFPVVSARDMLAAATARHPHCDVLIAAAAVSDYRPATRSERKHKRDGADWTLSLVANPDILRTLGERKEGRIHVGFALETEEHVENARRKLARKHLDWIVCNAPEAIGADEGAYTIVGRDGNERALGHVRKEQLAAALLDLIEAR